MTNLRADRDQPRPHPHIRVHAQHQEPRRVQAVVAHVDHLLALELDRVGVHQARDDERLLGARHAVQRQLPAQPPAAARVAHLGDRADDARILLGLEPALQLHVHQAVVRAQPLGVDLDAERGAEPDPPVGDLGLDLPDEPAGLAPHRVQARSRLGPEARLLGDDAPARHAAMVFQMGRKSKELYALCMQRIAIVNRGEAAMRLIVAARELPSVRTIALFTDADRRALFVREADERFHIGPAAAYLDLDRLAEALRRTRADAAWVGWGFVAENAAFADVCAPLGVTFIGPHAQTMRRPGDKISAKRLAEEVGVPVAPWSGGAVETIEEAHEHARRLGFPFVIKASAGGGGRGIRRVLAERDLDDAFNMARAEAQRSFGDATVFIEKMVRGGRHVDAQVIADRHGTVWALGTRDCSVQRRNQKVVEEGPASSLAPDEDRTLREAAVRLAQRVGYENAGTVEFLWDPAGRRAAFMEVNTRLQV